MSTVEKYTHFHKHNSSYGARICLMVILDIAEYSSSNINQVSGPSSPAIFVRVTHQHDDIDKQIGRLLHCHRSLLLATKQQQ
jgi:hypothetical protein